ASFHKTIEPLIISASPAQVNFMLIRISPEQPAATLGALQSSWERLAEGFPFEYFYLDESIDHLYHADWQASRMVIYFTALAILIACLGLFALAQFNLERRTKEIGIRKVLGASVSQVVMVLSGEFLWRILAANLVAWPLAYWVIDKWLENFAYQIDIGVGSFMIAGFAALLIALLTVGFQSLRAARANPVEALKYE
ncbi:MAG: FtsX-like permease family protein, partial [Phaeodactylibacter sp.]|nr:FtsX-like permease family protein [Phaeodactylibacter sp.]